MDEEQEILQSSIAQGDKISIDSFFGSPIGGLANRAIMQSNSSLQSSITNRGLIASLQASIELLKSQVRQITNYVLIDRQERNKLIRQRETEIFEREDDIQKGIVSPESAQPRGLEDSLPFFPEARFSEGLTAGMSSIGERQGVAQFQERFAEGSKPFFFGGLVPGSGDADTVNAKLTPGEFVVPKEKVEELGSNPLMDFIKGGGLVGALARKGRKLFGGGKEKEDVTINANRGNNYFPEGEDYLENEGDGPIFYNPNDVRNFLKKNDPKLLKQFSSKSDLKNYKLNDKQGKIIEFKGGVSSGDAIPSNLINEKGEVTGSYSTYPTDDEFSVTAKDENKRGLFGVIGGTIDAATGNLTDFDRRGGKPFGLMRGITGTIDAATGGLTDLDRRGGKPFGLMRGITGSIDAMSGGLTDLDRRGGNPFGLMRGITGIADAMTGDKFDFDRRGKGEEMTEGFSTYPIDEGEGKQRSITVNYNEKLKEALKRREGYIESGDQSRLVGVDRKINFYKNKLESGVTEEEIPVTVKPEETTSSTDIKPKETLGEKFMNIFKGKEMKEGFSTYPSKSETPSIEPVSQDNLKVAPSESIKETSQNLMTPPPPPPSETIELPPQIQGGGGGDNSISQAAPSFNPSTPSHDPLTGTESPLIFVEVISNPFLSIP